MYSIYMYCEVKRYFCYNILIELLIFYYVINYFYRFKHDISELVYQPIMLLISPMYVCSSSNPRTMEFHFIIETSEQSKMATFEKTLFSRGLVGDIPFYNTSLSIKSIPGEH